jgi:hypothetical protein
MNRAIVVALFTGAVFSSAAALRIGAQPVAVAHVQATRVAQRERIEARYLVDRAKCSDMGGIKRDNCLIASHAARGRDLLEAAAPYEMRL